MDLHLNGQVVRFRAVFPGIGASNTLIRLVCRIGLVVFVLSEALGTLVIANI